MNYTVRKLPHYQVLRVMSRTKQGQTIMRELRRLQDGTVPEGCYVLGSNRLLLPKRKRGEKFVVHYTEVKEAVL